MSRKTTFNDPARQVVQTSEDQHKYDTPTFRRLEVNAQPVNMFVTPNYTQQANSLSLALAEAAPSLAIFSAGASHEFHQDAFQRGQTARLEESDVDPKDSKALSIFSSPSFKKGYMNLAGFQKGQELEGQMLADYETDTSRNSMTTQEWTAQWLKKNVGEVDSSAYAAGLNEKLVPAVKAVWKQGVTDKVADLTADVTAKKNSVFQAAFQNGWTPEIAEQTRLTLIGDGTENNPGVIAMSKGDWDREVVDQLKTFITKGGDYDKAERVFKWMDEKRPDGTPGISSKPGMAQTLAKLKNDAADMFLANQHRQESLDRNGRNDDQRAKINELYDIAITKGEATALAQLTAFYKSNKDTFTPQMWKSVASEIRGIGTIRKGLAGDGAAVSAEVLRLVDGIDSGELDPREVLTSLRAGKINMHDFTQVNTMVGQLQSRDRGRFKTPEFTEAETHMGKFSMGKGEVDIDGYIANNYRQLNNDNKNELRRRVTNGEKPMVVADEIRKRTEGLVKSGALRDRNFSSRGSITPDTSANTGSYVSKYQTFDEFDKAFKGGRVTGATLQAEKKFWQDKINAQKDNK